MLQLIYVSTGTGVPKLTSEILEVSRRNNLRDGITGLLYSDEKRFLQALEGPEHAVEAALARITDDKRHRAIVTLSRRTVDRREFGSWSMAHRMPDQSGDVFLARVGQLLENTSANVRATFEGFVKLRVAA
jgi:hypothetical protein